MSTHVLDELDSERLDLLRLVEEAKSDADWRTLGGFGTEDTKFALSTRELMNEVIFFLDHYQDTVDTQVAELKGEIDMRDEEISGHVKTLSQIEHWVEDATRLAGVTDIIKKNQQW